jgi:hypothetical protein
VELTQTAFIHAAHAQVFLPRGAAASATWDAQFNGTGLHMRAAQARGLPAGCMPRMILAVLSTKAVLAGTREVPVAHSANQFLRLIGVDENSPRHRALDRQSQALAHCGMQVRLPNQPLIQVLEREATSQTDRPNALFSLRLTQGFYDSLVNNFVPLDFQALRRLNGSSMALDVYAWLAYRLPRLDEQSEEVSWRTLREQFGRQYNDQRDLKVSFRDAAKAAARVYRQSAHRVRITTTGMVLQRATKPDSRIRFNLRGRRSSRKVS